MAITGIQGAQSVTDPEFNFFFTVLDNIALSKALRYGGMAGLIVSMGLAYRHVLNKEVTLPDF